MKKLLTLLAALAAIPAARAQRVAIPLDGVWQIEDSVAPAPMPSQWRHTGPVPGMANLARPAFPHVDEYLTADNARNLVFWKVLPPGAPPPPLGPKHERNWFWYRRTFRAPAARPIATLRIAKAQFSTAVWLNGKPVGEHTGSSTAGYFDLTPAIIWSGDNTLTVRIGAHPRVLPPNIVTGTDFEKAKWTAGIYDSVSLLLSGNPVIESLQVAPRVAPPAITVQTVVRNRGASSVKFSLTHRVNAAAGGAFTAASQPLPLTLAPGEAKTLTQEIALPNARLWSPESPFLYRLESSTGGDSFSTRFGVREFRFDSATRRAYLNGKPYFLRGSNITLHRFFEDPDVGALPWTESWVRRMLIEIPKWMNWNSFRFCIGLVPERWLDLADEAGFLIQYEFPIWTAAKHRTGPNPPQWDEADLKTQFTEFVRDNWNHPSVVIWDANNETQDDIFHQSIIPHVRKLDLSNRPWENSYNLPAGPNDPVEDHAYLFHQTKIDGRSFRIADLERMTGQHAQRTLSPHGHAVLLNEYGWLWLLRDGTPSQVSQTVYEEILGKNATPADRIELNHYYLGGLTEYWRAWRYYAGVLHFVYLTFCYPHAYTCDNFQDVANLKLHPQFATYVREAFKPTGVYINFWQPTLAPGSAQRLHVMMVNDYDTPVAGTLAFTLEDSSGNIVLREQQPYALSALGQMTYLFKIKVPSGAGNHLLKAVARPAAGPQKETTTSVRKVTLAKGPQR